MTVVSKPSLQDFLQAPASEVAKVAPQTIILTTGGTRRAAALAGISPTTDEYAAFTRLQLMTALRLLFSHGIQYVFATALTATNYREVTPQFREHLARWADRGLAGPEALADYKRLQWQARLLITGGWPELASTAARLKEEIPERPGGPAVWFLASASPDESWDYWRTIIAKYPTYSRHELIRTIFGQDIPPATLYLGSGKPQFLMSLIPPVIVGDMECYWRQDLGFHLDQDTLRRILYDYAYVRKTWIADKSERTEKVQHYRQAWENPPVVGLGTRLGPFWYPAPISPVPDPLHEGHPHG